MKSATKTDSTTRYSLVNTNSTLQEMSSYQRRQRRRLLVIVCCLSVLLFLSIGLLVELFVLILRLLPSPDGGSSVSGGDGGGTAWTDAGPRRLDTAGNVDRDELEAGRSSRWLVSQPKCHIPVIDPWHESIRGYVKKKAPLNCKQIFRDHAEAKKLDTGPPLTYTRDNQLHFTRRAIKLGYANQKCCYRPLRRSYANDDDLESDEQCYVISGNGPFVMPFGLVKIFCQQERIPAAAFSAPNSTNDRTNKYQTTDNNNNNTSSNQQKKRRQTTPSAGVDVVKNATLLSEAIYTNVHSFIVRDLEEEAALDRVASRRLNRDDYYNVLMVGVDTISRLNGYRQLNRTLTRLKQEYETLEFVGYNKVGENTFPNLVPFLTGLRPEQLTEIQCWQASNYSQESERGDDFMDNCKYLWNYYQELGYITYFSEDWPKASTFNYLKQGFRLEPTSFYGRPFSLARDDLLLPPVGMGCSSCLLDRPLVQVDLENLKNFLKIHRQRPHFAFHWVNCPQHDDLNGASQVDSYYEEFFRELKHITRDGRTFVIFFSDHGYRWNDFVSTRVGHYESSLPLLTIAPPKRFIQRHPDLYRNLKSHQSALLTPFDMFKTLIGLRDLAKLRDSPTQVGSSPNAPVAAAAPPPPTTKNPLIFEDPQYTSGPTAATTIRQLKMLDGLSYKQKFATLSLFEAHNSKQLDRNCIGAGIPDNYCVCHEFEATGNNSTDVIGAAYYLVYVHLYTKLVEHREQCRLLDLEQVHKAEVFDFKQKTPQTTTTSKPAIDSADAANAKKMRDIVGAPSPTPETTTEIGEQPHFLPSREYNVRLSTRPGGALFQEVIRYYGPEDMDSCRLAIEATKLTIESLASENADDDELFEQKHKSVMKMNEACRFSVHSDSISRLNLYKEQSKCVKSNIELKKICYCANLSSSSSK